MPNPSYVQSASNSSGSTAVPSIGATFLSPVGDRRRLVAFVNWGATTGSTARIDDTVNGPGAWRRVPNSNVVDAAGPQQGEFWELVRSVAGTPTITAVFDSNKTFCGIAVHEIKDADAGLWAEAATASAVETASTTFNSNNLTPSVDGCLLIGACTNSTDASQPVAAGAFTLREKTTANQILGTEDQVQSTAAAVHAAFTFASAVTGTVHLIVIRPQMPYTTRRPLAAQLR